MSKVVTNEIDSINGVDEVSIPTLEKRFAFAWLVYDGTTNTILDSYNVASVTDAGTGQYTCNFDTSPSSANYTCVNNHSSGSTEAGNGHINCNTKTTSSFSIQIETSSGVQEDAVVVDVVVFGE